MAVRNPTLCQVVRGQFHGDTVPGEYSDSIAAEFPGKVSQNGAVCIQLNAEQAARELFDYGPGHSARQGGLFFTRDPRTGHLSLRARGYSAP